MPYDFRRNFLIHKTNAHTWRSMSNCDDRHLRPRHRDIHLVPLEVLYYESDIFRQYGSCILLFNMNNERKREAFKSARETRNGYICVNEDINLDRLEAVYNLDNTDWEAFCQPVTPPRDQAGHGLDLASPILHYFSRVEHKSEIYFDDLQPALWETLVLMGEDFEKWLRHYGGPPPPNDATADNTAQEERSKSVREQTTERVSAEVFEQVMTEQKKRAEAKAMHTH